MKSGFTFSIRRLLRIVFCSDKYLSSYDRHAHRNASTYSCKVTVNIVRIKPKLEFCRDILVKLTCNCEQTRNGVQKPPLLRSSTVIDKQIMFPWLHVLKFMRPELEVRHNLRGLKTNQHYLSSIRNVGYSI
jgi:hypothetical protein